MSDTAQRYAGSHLQQAAPITGQDDGAEVAAAAAPTVPPQQQPQQQQQQTSSIVLTNDAYEEALVPRRQGDLERWCVHSSFQLLSQLGSGAYGTVVAALDRRIGKEIAIKRVSRPFHRSLDAKRLLREVKLLRMFKGHDNILQLLEVMKPRTWEDFDNVYMVMELMDSDLHDILEQSEQFQLQHAQYFLYQILRGLRYMHAANVVHRDLKPSNLLVNRNCDLKICDLGMARYVGAVESHAAENPLTMYVTTRWYRAPEVVLCSKTYTGAVDVWSVGCIFAELLGKLERDLARRRPLFPGRDYRDQLHKIVQIVGSPQREDLEGFGSENALRYLESLGQRDPLDFRLLYPMASADALDLLQRMLQFSPHKRITVAEALRHPFLRDFWDPNDEIVRLPPSVNFDFEYLGPLEIKNLMYEEVRLYHPELPPLQAAPIAGAPPTLSNQ